MTSKIKSEERSPSIALIGNKCDLEHLRNVKHKDGKQLAEKYGAKFWETSASESYDSLSSPLTSLIVNSYLKSKGEPTNESESPDERKWSNVSEKKRTIQRRSKGKKSSNLMSGKLHSRSLTDLHSLNEEKEELGGKRRLRRSNSMREHKDTDTKKDSKRENKKTSLRRSKSLKVLATSSDQGTGEEKNLGEQMKSVSTLSMADIEQSKTKDIGNTSWLGIRKGRSLAISSERIDKSGGGDDDVCIDKSSGQSVKSRFSNLFRSLSK